MASNLDEEAPSGGAAAATPTVTTYTPPTSETPDSMTRKWVSYLLLALLSIIIVAAFADLFAINAENPAPGALANMVADDAVQDADRLMRLMNVVFGPVVTLFSSVVGFYFGARTARESGAGGDGKG